MHVDRSIESPRLNPKPVTGYVPDFSEGLCTSERGVNIARAGLTQEASLRAIRARDDAKALCNAGPCPLLLMCRAWVRKQESPPGSWGGVYGGLDSWNRRGLRLIIRDGKATVIPYDVDQR